MQTLVYGLGAVDDGKELLGTLCAPVFIVGFCCSNGSGEGLIGFDGRLGRLYGLSQWSRYRGVAAGIIFLQLGLGSSDACVQIGEHGLLHFLFYIAFGRVYIVLQFLLEVGKLTTGIVESEVVDSNPVARSVLGQESYRSLILDIDEGDRIFIFARDLCLGVVGHDPCILLCSRASLLDVLRGCLEDVYTQSEVLHALHHTGIAYLASFVSPLFYIDVSMLQVEGRV